MSSMSNLWHIIKPFLCPDTRNQGEAPPSLLLFEEAVESKVVIPQPAFLQIRQFQSPQMLLMGHSFQSIHQVYCHPMDAFECFKKFPKLCVPEQRTALKVRWQQHCKHQDNHLWLAGEVVFDAPWYKYILHIQIDIIEYLSYLYTACLSYLLLATLYILSLY